jgi:hypothetical protein
VHRINIFGDSENICVREAIDWDCILMLCIKIQLQLKHLCCDEQFVP